MNILEYGHWDGDQFVFDKPLIIQGCVVESIDFRQLITPAGMDASVRQELMENTVEDFLQPDVEDRIGDVRPEDSPFYGGPIPNMN